MWPWKELVCLLWLCTLQGSVVAETCEREGKLGGCTVKNAHARCDLELLSITESVQALPTCVTKLTISFLSPPNLENTYGFKMLPLGEAANFSRLLHLEEFIISTNQRHFPHVRLDIYSGLGLSGANQLSLRALRIRMLIGTIPLVPETAAFFASFKNLETLELTRTQKNGFSDIYHMLGEAFMQTLILKNVQQMRSLRYTPTVDLGFFACPGNVEVLDLSYNDIVVVNVSSSCWNSKLKYLNMDHNLLTQAVPHQYYAWNIVPMFAGVQEVRLSSIGDAYQAGLWDELPEVNIVDVNATSLLPNSAMTFLQGTPIGFLAGFDYYLRDLLKPCKQLSYLGLLKCAVTHPHDEDAILQCLDPKLSSYSCDQWDINIYHKITCLLLRHCSYRCREEILLPFPPNLRSVTAHTFGQFNSIIDIRVTCPGAVNIHFDPHNTLQVWDTPNMNMRLPIGFNRSVSLNGFHQMKYINVHDHRVPFLVSWLNISDMRNLEELHIGGERVSEQDKLPSYPLQSLTKLSVLNLSYASLREIAADAFSANARLSVLDLSHNELSVESLSSLQLSHTKLRSLNLSHNRLTSLPASLHRQLEGMSGLQVDLSGNTFICSCENLAFLQWIQSDLPITFHYAGDHVCADSPGNTIHSIAVDSLYCNWYWQQPLIILASVLGALLLILLVATVYKKRYHISNAVFRLQEWFSRDDNSATTYSFDAYVIYSDVDGDRLWVHYELRDALEERFGLRLCLEHRNFVPGEDRVDNIAKAIRTSRKVVLVLSPDFLQGDWCLKACQLAANFDARKFVVIHYKDVLFSGVHIPPHIQLILQDSSIAITWNEKPKKAAELFWKNLRRALYNKRPLHETDGPRDRIVLLHDIRNTTSAS